MESFHCLKQLFEENDFLRKRDPKEALFLSTAVHEVKKFCEAHLIGRSLQISALLLWIRVCF